MSGFSTIKVETLMNLANQGQIAKLKPTKVKSPSKISTIKIICYLQNKCFVNSESLYVLTNKLVHAKMTQKYLYMIRSPMVPSFFDWTYHNQVMAL